MHCRSSPRPSALVADEAAAAAELTSAIRRLAAEEGPTRRLDELLAKARETASTIGKVELQVAVESERAAATANPG